jgi:hypothetical protein
MEVQTLFGYLRPRETGGIGDGTADAAIEM